MPQHPNIVLIVTDDHGAWATGYSGQAPGLRTPTLNALVRGGVSMDRAYTPTPVCSPGRASVMTGLIASQHGIHDWLREHERGQGSVCRVDDQITLPEVFQPAGYECLFSGKWHLGASETPRKGWDRWFSIGQPQGGHSGEQRYSVDGEIVTIDGFKTRVVTDRALRFLEERDRKRPFFLFVGYIGTHGPWEGHPERLVEPYRRLGFDAIPKPEPHEWAIALSRHIGDTESLAQYYASVTHIDEGVGRLVDALEEQGALEDTLIVYTADHGLCCGHHGVWGKGNGTEPKNMFEASIRVPMALHHAGAIPGDRRITRIVDHCDLFLTLPDYAGVPLPEALDRDRLPGTSFAPMLRGEPQPWEDLYCGEYGPVRCIVTPEWKYVHRYQHPTNELYDRQADPDETQNLADNPAYAEVVRDLRERMEAWYARYEDPARSGLNQEP